MSQDVTQWLSEIKALRQQLAEAYRDRDAADASAKNWRQLYETEAQQRRTEASLTRQTIEALKAELQQLRSLPEPALNESISLSEIQQELTSLNTVEELKAKLTEVLADRTRLAQALKAEQASHTQTRKSLTTALGDTIDMLAKERAGKQLEA